eukprot:TRINITY_DN5696_c0_g1_i3.p1 TRINITY_DN5696_c0_g1~~TRINITY_DN5696_c0_g1_i3.p1  ORF type:complete len:247 (+),score=48.89 TRINITY_DN5696_c0_g1_i3:121-861(+)
MAVMRSLLRLSHQISPALARSNVPYLTSVSRLPPSMGKAVRLFRNFSNEPKDPETSETPSAEAGLRVDITDSSSSAASAEPSSADAPVESSESQPAVNNRFNIANMSDVDADDWIREVEMKRRGNKAKLQEDIESGLAHVKITSNNTIVTISRLNGNPLNWSSSGASGFKGARRSTTYAAQMAGQNAAKVARDKGMKFVRVLFKGIGASRGPVLKGIQAGGLKVTAISDVTSVPHNGCRPKKQRRL